MNVEETARGAGSFLNVQGKAVNADKTQMCSKIFLLFIWKKDYIFRLHENDKYIHFNKEFSDTFFISKEL